MALRTKLEELSQGLEGQATEDIRDEWLAAVDRLEDMLAEFVADYMQSGLISLSTFSENRHEARLGHYVIRIVQFSSGNSQVLMLPVARMIAGFSGRCDLFSKSRPGFGFNILRPRGAIPVEGSWRIVARETNSLAPVIPGPLDAGTITWDQALTKEAFEAALESLI